ncbi:MAG: hypothetical protein WCH13_06120, partial [Deltaproteobacteria bacterium]
MRPRISPRQSRGGGGGSWGTKALIIDRAQDFRLIGGGRAYGRPQNFGGAFPRLLRNAGVRRNV